MITKGRFLPDLGLNKRDKSTLKGELDSLDKAGARRASLLQLNQSQLGLTADKSKPVHMSYVPPDCLTAFRDEDFHLFAGQVIKQVTNKDKGSTINQRRRMLISTIREKITEMGMTSNAKRTTDKSPYPLVHKIKARRGQVVFEEANTNPRDELR